MHHTEEFGYLTCPEQPAYAVELAHALIHDYFVNRRPMGYLPQTLNDLEGYVATVMEDIDGWQWLSHERKHRLLWDGIQFLNTLTEATDRLHGDLTMPRVPYQHPKSGGVLLVV